MEGGTSPWVIEASPERSFFSNPTIRGFGEHRKLPSGFWSRASATNAFGTFGIRDGSRNLFLGGPNQGPQSKVKGEARIEGEARELRAKPEPRAKPEKKRGEGSGEGARWAPPQKMFEKSNLKPFILVHIWSNYLKWLTKWFNCPLSWKIISNNIIWCDGIIKFCWSIKIDRGSGGRSPPEAKTF